jgi:hypothetical protein
LIASVFRRGRAIPERRLKAECKYWNHPENGLSLPPLFYRLAR